MTDDDAVRIEVLESLLVEKGLVDPGLVDKVLEHPTSSTVPTWSARRVTTTTIERYRIRRPHIRWPRGVTSLISDISVPRSALFSSPRRRRILVARLGYARVPTAIRYSCSKYAASSLPRFHSSQKWFRASSNSCWRSVLTAFARATRVGP